MEPEGRDPVEAGRRMKIAILGGTGKMGAGVAKHLSKKNEVIIGSRDRERAALAAREIPGASGAGYLEASRESDAAIFAIPYAAIGVASDLAGALSGKLAISMMNPMKSEGGLLRFALEHGSAAQELAKLLPGSRVATAFNNIPALFLNSEVVPRLDVLVAADEEETFKETAAIVSSIENMRPLYLGPLSEAGMVERVTSLVLNLAKLNKTGSLSTRFVSKRE